MHVIQMYYLGYKKLQVHESSPGAGGVSAKLEALCAGYSTSHYAPPRWWLLTTWIWAYGLSILKF